MNTLTIDVPKGIALVEHAAIVASTDASLSVVSPNHSPSKPFFSASELSVEMCCELRSPLPLNIMLTDKVLCVAY